MSNTKGWKYVRGKGLVERFGEKRAKELEKAINEATQPEDMDCQGGSDENSSYEKANKVKGR